MLKDLKQFVPTEVCLKCDGCCRFKESTSSWRPKAAPAEKNQGGLADEIFSKNSLDRTGRIKTVPCSNGGYQCSFFEPAGNHCRIYQQRPFECQLYPFIIRKDSNRMVIDVHLNCPFVQETMNTPVFDRYVEYLKKFFNRKEVSKFLCDNPGFVGNYSEYRNELKTLFTIDDVKT